jgi:hypothetical protein
MQTVSALWTTLLENSRHFEFKATINGVDYGHDKIVSYEIKRAAFEKLGIGNACASTLEMAFYPSGDIPEMAKISCYIRVRSEYDTELISDEFGNLILTDDGYYLASRIMETSEWLPFGVYWIDTREISQASGVMSVVAYDGMLLTERDYSSDYSSFTLSMASAVSYICTQTGLTLDSRTSVPSYTIENPAGYYTMREVLEYVAAAGGGNWIITESGQLRLVPLASPSVTTSVLCGSCDTLGASVTIGKVTLTDGDNVSYTAGSSGYEIKASCLYASQTMVNNLWALLSGKTYTPLKASDVLINPAQEIGDSINLAGNQTVLESVTYHGGPALIADAEAPIEESVNHEYPIRATSESERRKKLADAKKAAEDAAAAAAAAQSTANTAQSTANTAQSSADSAYSLAQAANSTANDASSVVYGFRYAGSSVQINGANLIADTVTASMLQGGEVDLITSSNSVAGSIYITGATSANYKIQFMSAGAMEIDASYGDLYLRSGYGSALDLNSALITSNVNFCPSTSGGAYLGLSNRYWAGAYLGSSTITTSDRRKKKDIDYNFEKFDAFFEHLRAATFKFKDGTSGRTHHGMIAQDVEKAMRDCGIDDFAGFVKSPHVCKNGAIGKSYDYALRYEEFIPMLIHRAQQDRQLIDELTKRIDDLEKGVS